ncbi:hypothetical protein BOTBODRAFT_119341 [Botryobasidium botryosum FD-172 SS1]|uniref:Phytocyanin domain-containing protein n=1 Tax=Botryobasidium botryosum (strain FD-172 SS1) TaxID=930990 RepID=A0A067M7T8_BOTB1|nr:hypothetical protein BOTBODRAFT_119341 [Botryobasidium botryosum FD-172 SS1]
MNYSPDNSNSGSNYGGSSSWDPSSSSNYGSGSSSYNMPQYGSGSSSWGSSGYNDCVQQCMAQYPPPPSYTATPPPPPPPTSTYSSSSSGSGVTHTVIVAPTQGVLRFVPFTVNASVGDTIHYVWGAGPHTVTKSSELTICNKSMDASTFASGPQNATFQFDVQVNDTNPIFYYCGVATHCEKGMFGIVNPPNADPTSSTSLGSMMPSLCANDTNLANMWSYTKNMTAGTSAAGWGSSYDMSGMPSWAHGAFAENIMYVSSLLVL